MSSHYLQSQVVKLGTKRPLENHGRTEKLLSSGQSLSLGPHVVKSTKLRTLCEICLKLTTNSGNLNTLLRPNEAYLRNAFS